MHYEKNQNQRRGGLVAGVARLYVYDCAFCFGYLVVKFNVMSEEKKESQPWWVSLIILGLCVYGVGLVLGTWDRDWET